ncbi:chitobiosyldiphosphodolichol beta-mannosyltransferase isoform X2 [Daktulosphaira vitifoliae]|uniref:chitobiosyldiphosphodolichol beta-mannosyltransferase isoform X2 n=1 Tax=Daktulosphaira vitifoliae TaxID=58002 RepID=UPI0021AAEB76|nr:chitobiosyldiphosphodolichol beta-mannosyltransferase isoform X2 [Daktulosphaira vitifoliae]
MYFLSRLLGDIGRSPRMQYHAQSLINEGFDVDIIGYLESPVLTGIKEKSNIISLKKVPSFEKYVPRLMSFILKVYWQILTLFWAILIKRKSDIVLVQNPPAIPTLAICWFYCLLVNAKFIIDWHNYAYSVLALTVGKSAPLVKLSLLYEKFFGKLADANFCVTKAMREDLAVNWNIRALTLFDKPGQQFSTKVTKAEKIRVLKSINLPSLVEEQLVTGQIGLLVSSTSWTPDEDFFILLRSLQKYDESDDTYPKLVCVITGKGPLKYHYQQVISKIIWKKVTIVTPWLQNEDYPILLASADLGVCLHNSSSGLDLPMKVIDMFGVCLPVCAYNFNCLHELVKHNENSLVFSDEEELSLQISTWFKGFPKEICEKKEQFCTEINKFRSTDWHTNWMAVAFPYILNIDK